LASCGRCVRMLSSARSQPVLPVRRRPWGTPPNSLRVLGSPATAYVSPEVRNVIARVATFNHLDPSALNPDAVQRLRTTIKSSPGFVAGFHLRDPESGKAVSFTVYESPEALRTVDGRSVLRRRADVARDVRRRWAAGHANRGSYRFGSAGSALRSRSCSRSFRSAGPVWSGPSRSGCS